MSRESQAESPAELISEMQTHEHLCLRGEADLIRLRAALKDPNLGLMLFEPDSDPELVDFLTGGSIAGLAGAITGGVLGAILGTFLDRPKLGAALGAVVGGALGVQKAVERIEDGWRILVNREEGEPVITIHRTGGGGRED